MGDRSQTVPLTEFQTQVALLLSQNRTEDSHLAGGAALHFQPHSIRYSEDLDYFHDSEARVAAAFAADKKLLEANAYDIQIEISQPGYIRSVVKKKSKSTKVEWAYDSAWRFLPVKKVKGIGYILDPIDLALNKLLALVGRDEPRDYLDVLHTHEFILPLGAQCWAACGKDPGLNPHSLMELLKRRGKYRPEDFKRLHLNQKIDIQELKKKWLLALEGAENFIRKAPGDQIGCLFYSKSKLKFIQPTFNEPKGEFVFHFGQMHGVLPKLIEES